MSDTRSTKTRWIGWAFVLAQFGVIGLMVVLPRETHYIASSGWRALGMVSMVVGGAIGFWSAFFLGRGLTPTPVPNGATELVTRGPYRFVRHPMYVAVVLFMGGVAIRSGTWFAWPLLVGLIALFVVKSRWEEEQLEEVFRGYGAYKGRTPRFVPGTKR
jgi:protein-S-isoprenylcysteine O-methyltransferase Ste14